LSKRLIRKQFSFDIVYSSDLARAVETTKILADNLQIPSTKIIYTKLLREHALGTFEGVKYTDLSPERKNLFQEVLENPSKRFPGGESINDYVSRLKAFLYILDNLDPPPQSVLIVTHGGTLYQLLIRIWKVIPDIDGWFKNCAMTLVEQRNATEWELITLNE
jgi:probable phosphoglycerate mutase